MGGYISEITRYNNIHNIILYKRIIINYYDNLNELFSRRLFIGCDFIQLSFYT